ncbi:MAG: ribonuclease P protein component [Flavobacteriaceae bacterium]|nr:ribonuclease P protein component [Flavobacteriaceae bacterium]
MNSVQKPRFTYPKAAKLKSKAGINRLFLEGKSLFVYPIRAVFVFHPKAAEAVSVKVGVSVSKRHFKRATDRNRIKRLLREAYRLNQGLVPEQKTHDLSCMLTFIGKEMPDFKTIFKNVGEILRQLNP